MNFTITEERLREIQTAPREALIAKAEAQKLCDSYRALSTTAGNEGVLVDLPHLHSCDCEDCVPKLKPISAPSLLQDALNELYAGFAFIRHSVPCDSIDKEHLHAAYVLLYRVVEAQK
jgi:hypothetical protein